MFNNTGYQQGGQFSGAMLPQRTGQHPVNYHQTGYGQLPPQQTGFQTAYQQPLQQQQPPATSFGSQLNQPNGFGAQQSLYSQPTGFVQPQQTGFVQSQPTGFVQPQSTGYVSGNQFGQPQQSQFGLQQQQPLAPQKTGFSSAAQSIEKNDELKIPNIRLSFLTAADQQKFEDLFRSAVPKKSNAITADAARDVLMRSGLQPTQLARIWELSDLNKSGQLLFPEFALALHLCNVALKGSQIQYQLESNVKNEVEGFVDAINFSIPDDDAPQRSTPFDNLQKQSSISQLSGLQMQPPQTSFGQPLISQASGYQPLQAQATGFQPLQSQATGFQPLQSQATGYQPLQPQATSFQQPLQGQATGFAPNYNPPASLQQQKTGVANNSMFSTPGLLQQQKTGVGNNTMFQSNYLQPQRTGFTGFSQYQNLPPQQNQEFIKPQEKELFSRIFETYDTSKKGHLDPQLSAEIFRKSGLNRSELEKVWDLITNESTTYLSKESFSLGMWLIYRKLNGNELPNRLPDSLLPESVKNVNYVKDKLKSTPSFGTQSSSTSSSSFKNDESNELNSSKNRRKAESFTQDTSSVDSLKKQIQEKRTQLDTLNASTAKEAEGESKELQDIENLKSKIRNLPKSDVSNNTSQQKVELNNLVSRVPNLISEISRIDNDIANSKIELYKIQHPSSIAGTGPNGEVTESDKRKAKSKALLAQSMAALTGKAVTDPSEDFDNEQQQLSEEVSRIKTKNKETQEIIYDIEKTIKDISQGVLSSLNKESDPSSYRKFELGLDVQPDVAELVESLRISSVPSQAPSSVQATAPISSTPSPAVSSPSPAAAAHSYSSYKTPEDRAAFVKEQAKKRMNERLAKLGISRRGGSKAEPSTPSPIPSPAPVQAAPVLAAQPTQPAQASVAQTAAQPLQQAPSPVKAATPRPPPSSRAPAKVHVKQQDSDDEVDEEELRLQKQLEDLKKKKKADKEARLAQLRRELESAENEEEEQEAPEQDVQTFTPKPQPTHNNNVPPPAVQAESKPAESQEVKHHESNPFFKPQAPATSSNNPFGKPQQSQAPAQPQAPSYKPQAPSQTPSFDTKSIEAQRKAQRGFDDDDGWSSEDNKSDDDDDEPPNRQGAAHLAGLLFSGMGPTRTNADSQVSLPKQESKSLNDVKEKPVPIAAPIPSISSTPSVNEILKVPELATQPVPVAPPIPQAASQPVPVAPPIPQPLQSSPIPPTPASPPYPTAEGPADDAFAAHPHPELDGQSDDDQFVDSMSMPAPEAPPLPPTSAPAPPPLPQASAPSPPPLPQASAPPAPPLPESSAPAPPPLPQMNALAPPPLPQENLPPPPPLPQSNAPAAPSFGPPPPPPPLAPAPSSGSLAAASAPIGGGLPFLADIQKRRDESHVVG